MWSSGKLLIVFGVALIGMGALVLLTQRWRWIGHLPGDIWYRGKHVSVYFPIVTCLLLSLLLTLAIWLFQWISHGRR